MPITTAFTLTASLALIVNSLFLLRAIQRVQALNVLAQNGSLRRIAWAFVQIWITMIVIDVFMILAGVGILSGGGGRVLGYLLAAIPVAHVLYGVFALRGFE